MPIPPSLEPEQISLELSGEECPTPEASCVALTGAPGAVEAGATVIVSSLFPEQPPVDVPYVAVVADAEGAFEVPALSAAPEAVLRTIVHYTDSTEVVNLLADTSVESPWPVAALDDEQAGTCLAYSPEQIDFGSTAVGDTVTVFVEVRNTCAETRSTAISYVVALPDDVTQSPFGALSRYAELDEGESVDVVVAFWPEAEQRYVGAIFIDSYGMSSGVETALSIPVRGTATAP
jgi:hypothetical protein